MSEPKEILTHSIIEYETTKDNNYIIIKASILKRGDKALGDTYPEYYVAFWCGDKYGELWYDIPYHEYKKTYNEEWYYIVIDTYGETYRIAGIYSVDNWTLSNELIDNVVIIDNEQKELYKKSKEMEIEKAFLSAINTTTDKDNSNNFKKRLYFCLGIMCIVVLPIFFSLVMKIELNSFIHSAMFVIGVLFIVFGFRTDKKSDINIDNVTRQELEKMGECEDYPRR